MIDATPMPDEKGRVYAEHPDAQKSGTNVDGTKYAAVRAAMLKAIPRSKDGASFKELPELVLDRLPEGEIPGGGSIMWWTTTVKLDLEARGLIERVPGARPQRVRRVTGR